jgi:hypothetical protein
MWTEAMDRRSLWVRRSLCPALTFTFSAAFMSGDPRCELMVIVDMKAVRRRTVPMVSTRNGGKPHALLGRNRPPETMKLPIRLARFGNLLTIVLFAGAWSILSTNLHAAEPKEAQQKPGAPPRSFASPDEAVKALQAAGEAKDRAALREIFGPEFDELSTGDEVQDANNAQRFATALAQNCTPVKEGEDKIIFEVGTNNYPMAIPLVKADGRWHFDTAAGREEIINRHIGKDELHAIGVCRAYVAAQRQYAEMNPKVGGGANYARKFKSTPGKKDGLYWPVAENEPASPFGPLVAEAHAEGYGRHKGGGPHPFHGYYFRILTRQGNAAAGGKMNYLSAGTLAGGFALVAYPEYWDKSGVMTFIVNQDGKVFQRNLGEKTGRIAVGMKEYNPDGGWVLVQDEGVLGAVSEK